VVEIVFLDFVPRITRMGTDDRALFPLFAPVKWIGRLCPEQEETKEEPALVVRWIEGGT
jgi:hypothetical protein